MINYIKHQDVYEIRGEVGETLRLRWSILSALNVFLA